MTDTPTGETESEAPSNTQAPASVPTDNASNPDVERLRKELEQAQMRTNQLHNELEKERQTKEELRRKELEEKEQYRELYESEKQRAQNLQQEREAETRQAELTTATDAVFKDYPDNVVKAAKIAGISLNDDNETARNILKEKLDALQQTVGVQAPVNANNPSQQPTNQGDHNALTARNEEGYSKLGIAMARGGREADAAFTEYVKAHPQIQRVKERMREIATNGQ